MISKLKSTEIKVLMLVVLEHNPYYPQIPIGTAYILSALRELGIEPDILDLQLHKFNPSEFSSMLKRETYDVICYGFLFNSYQLAQQISQLTQAHSPNSRLIIGGSAPTASPEFCLRSLQANYAVIGEADDTIKEVINAICGNQRLDTIKGICYWLNGKPTLTAPRQACRNIDELPFPAYDRFDMQTYLRAAIPPGHRHNRYATVLTSRGCPYQCNFCFHTGGFRFRSAGNVIEELEWLVRNYQVDFVYFIDDVFMFSKKRVEELCDAILKSGLTFHFKIKARVNLVDAEMLATLKRAGCVSIFYGIESADQGILDYMNKKNTVEQILNAIRLTQEAGILVHTSGMLGQPPETVETAEKTIALMAELNDGHENHPRVLCALTPYPGSEVYHYAVRQGLLEDEQSFVDAFKSQYKPFINLTSLDDQTYADLLEKADRVITTAWASKRIHYLSEALANGRMPKDIFEEHLLNLNRIKTKLGLS